jgi:hypothetical protein
MCRCTTTSPGTTRPARVSLRLAKRSSQAASCWRCWMSSFSTATPPPASTPPFAGERQAARLLRVGSKPREQAHRASAHRTTITIAQRSNERRPRLGVSDSGRAPFQPSNRCPSAWRVDRGDPCLRASAVLRRRVAELVTRGPRIRVMTLGWGALLVGRKPAISLPLCRRSAARSTHYRVHSRCS